MNNKLKTLFKDLEFYMNDELVLKFISKRSDEENLQHIKNLFIDDNKTLSDNELEWFQTHKSGHSSNKFQKILKKVEYEILNSYYGLENDETLTIEELSKKFNRTTMFVDRYLSVAKNRIRSKRIYNYSSKLPMSNFLKTKPVKEVGESCVFYFSKNSENFDDFIPSKVDNNIVFTNELTHRLYLILQFNKLDSLDKVQAMSEEELKKLKHMTDSDLRDLKRILIFIKNNSLKKQYLLKTELSKLNIDDKLCDSLNSLNIKTIEDLINTSIETFKEIESERKIFGIKNYLKLIDIREKSCKKVFDLSTIPSFITLDTEETHNL